MYKPYYKLFILGPISFRALSETEMWAITQAEMNSGEEKNRSRREKKMKYSCHRQEKLSACIFISWKQNNSCIHIRLSWSDWCALQQSDGKRTGWGVVRTQIRIKKTWEMKSGAMKKPLHEMICVCYGTLDRLSLKVHLLFSFFYSMKWACVQSFNDNIRQM